MLVFSRSTKRLTAIPRAPLTFTTTSESASINARPSMSDVACIFTYVPSRLEIKLPINGQLVLGRGAMLDIKTVHMSRRQVEITSLDGRVFITRQGTNKSLLNGAELLKGRSTELKDGDTVTLLEKEYPVKVTIPSKPTTATRTPITPTATTVNESTTNGKEAKAQGVQPAPSKTPSKNLPADSVPHDISVNSEPSVVGAISTSAPAARQPSPNSNNHDESIVSEMHLAHQLQADVCEARKAQQQEASTTEAEKMIDADIGGPVQHGPPVAATTTRATAVGESEEGVEDPEENDSGSSSESDDDHDLQSGGSEARRRDTDGNRGHDEIMANGDDGEDAVMVEGYLSDESSYICSDMSDLEAEHSEGHFDFAKVHKIKRQGRVELLE